MASRKRIIVKTNKEIIEITNWKIMNNTIEQRIEKNGSREISRR